MTWLHLVIVLTILDDYFALFINVMVDKKQNDLWSIISKITAQILITSQKLTLMTRKFYKMFLTTDTEVQLKESENNDYNRITAH